MKAEIDRRLNKEKCDGASELLVGARRVHERQALQKWLEDKGFLAAAEHRREAPAFLIATSAGEVGVDLDANHMACDLVEWERMVQRFGRVNRRGKGSASIDVIAAPKKVESFTDWEERFIRLRPPLDLLPPLGDGRRDASPGAIAALKDGVEGSPRSRSAIEAATSLPSLHPPLTRALVDAWSMTSLEKHTGRPDVQPWLRGWEEEEPQTTVVWRRWLPWRYDDSEPVREDVNRFFAAAQVHLEETLTAATYQVFEHLTARADAALKAARKAWSDGALRAVREGDPALIVLDREGKMQDAMRLKELSGLAALKGNDKQRAIARFSGRTLVVSSLLSGLNREGMLESSWSDLPTTLDHLWDEETLERIGYRVIGPDGAEPDEDVWKPSETIRLTPPERSEGGEDNMLRVFVWRGKAAARESDPAISKRPQALREHHDWAGDAARYIAEALNLPEAYCEMLVVAARHHDAGKARDLWQDAMNAPRSCARPYAKTEGGGDGRRLNGYRHEFGSLRDVERAKAFDGLAPDLRDLALHLISAHHGHGRPVIAPLDPEAPLSEREERARRVTLQFARLQRRWGPWGLAWWEAVLRAADQRASARLEQETKD